MIYSSAIQVQTSADKRRAEILLAGNDSATENCESIGKFQTQNSRFFKHPYQEFKFPAVKASYLNVKVMSSHGFSSVGVYEFQLLGVL